LCHVEDQFPIVVFHLAQQAAKLVEKARFFAGRAPSDVIRRLPLRQVRQHWRFLTVIKEVIEWALESTREVLQRFNGWYRMTIFHAGNIAAQQPRTFLNVALGEFLFFAQSAKTVTNNHAGIVSYL